MTERTPLEPRRYFHFSFAAAMVVLTSFAAYTRSLPAISAVGLDKVGHATMATILTLLLAKALRGRAFLAALLVMVPLATDEYFQRFSAARTSDWNDLFADLVGAAIAIAATRALALRTKSVAARAHG